MIIEVKAFSIFQLHLQLHLSFLFHLKLILWIQHNSSCHWSSSMFQHERIILKMLKHVLLILNLLIINLYFGFLARQFIEEIVVCVFNLWVKGASFSAFHHLNRLNYGVRRLKVFVLFLFRLKTVSWLLKHKCIRLLLWCFGQRCFHAWFLKPKPIFLFRDDVFLAWLLKPKPIFLMRKSLFSAWFLKLEGFLMFLKSHFLTCVRELKFFTFFLFENSNRCCFRLCLVLLTKFEILTQCKFYWLSNTLRFVWGPRNFSKQFSLFILIALCDFILFFNRRRCW
jgi:hypothetical protein